MFASDAFDGFDTPEHHTAQAACHHFVHCAVNADTRRAICADLDNARATTPHLVPVYLAALTGPCTLPPATAAPESTPEVTVTTEPGTHNLPTDPNMLLDIITHAGTLGEDDDEQVRVRAFVNLDSGTYDDYTPGHRMREVYGVTMPDGDPLDICDEVYTLLEISDTAGGSLDPAVVAYQRRGHRPLELGGVIAVGDLYYAVGFDSYRPLSATPTVGDERQLTPGFLVTDTGGHAIGRGDTVRTPAGDHGTFEAVVRHDAVLINGREVAPAMYGLTVRVLATATEIGSLTAHQRRVIKEYLLPRDPARVKLHRTTARIELPPAEAVQLVAAARADLVGTSGRTYPLRPMTTVLNKFKAELAAAIERGVA